MKPGDKVIMKGKIIEGKSGIFSGVNWTAASTNDCLTLIEGKADIGGCILARDVGGEIHCINPSLFEVMWTQEEVVARKMMEPVPAIPVSFSEVERRLHQSLAKAMAISFDDAIINEMLSIANAEAARKLVKQLGMEKHEGENRD